MHDVSRFVIPISSERQLIAQAQSVYSLVWRVDFDAPGFAVLDIPPTVDSHTLRSWMVTLRRHLSDIAATHDQRGFAYQSMGRFDQQVTTKFHLDSAPDQSLLMLGYEPSDVLSRLFLADYTRAAFDLGMTPQEYLRAHNPMYEDGEKSLAPYTTELPQPTRGHSRIVLINNSSQPFSNGAKNQLGVLHKAIIVMPDDSKTRIVNSTMLAPGGTDLVSQEHQRTFVETNLISQRSY